MSVQTFLDKNLIVWKRKRGHWQKKKQTKKTHTKSVIVLCKSNLSVFQFIYFFKWFPFNLNSIDILYCLLLHIFSLSLFPGIFYCFGNVRLCSTITHIFNVSKNISVRYVCWTHMLCLLLLFVVERKSEYAWSLVFRWLGKVGWEATSAKGTKWAFYAFSMFGCCQMFTMDCDAFRLSCCINKAILCNCIHLCKRTTNSNKMLIT